MSRVVMMPSSLEVSLPVSAPRSLVTGIHSSLGKSRHAIPQTEISIDSPSHVHAADERKFKRVK